MQIKKKSKQIEKYIELCYKHCVYEQGVKLMKHLEYEIYNYKLSKLIPLSLMIFSITFMMGFLGIVKDLALMSDLQNFNNTADYASARAFDQSLVFWGTISFVLIYIILMNIFKREYLFYMLSTFSLLFFGFHTFFPGSIKTIEIFYQIWKVVSLPLFFWMIANQLTSVIQARHFYGFFALSGSLGIISSIFLTGTMHLFQQANIVNIMMIAVIGHLVLIASFYYLHHNTLSHTQEKNIDCKNNYKGKGNVYYFGLIFLLLFVSTITGKIFQGIWREQIHLVFTSTPEFNEFMGSQGATTGFMFIPLSIAVIYCMYRFSWKACALIMPIALLVSFTIFLSIITLGNTIDPEFLKTATFLGGYIQNFDTGLSGTFFMLTIQMAYLPLNTNLRAKGQVTLDVIGRIISTKIANLLPIVLFTNTSGKFDSFIQISGPLLITLMIIWIVCVMKLSKKFEDLISLK